MTLAGLLYTFFFEEKVRVQPFFSEMQSIEKHELAFNRKAVNEESSLLQWI